MSVTAPRDLAWCRAAFRDLDAPLPGQGVVSSPWSTPRRSWSVGPVDPGPFASQLAPAPDTAALVERVVLRSGVSPRRVDGVGATLLAWDEITRVGSRQLQGEPGLPQALLAVRERWDLDEPMLWNFFGHHGEAGVHAQRDVVRELYTQGLLERTLAAAIGSGDLLRF